MTNAVASRVFLRLLCVEGIARGISAAQSVAWLAGVAVGAWAGSSVPALALWGVTEAVALAVILGLQGWVWLHRAAPPRPEHDLALFVGALAGLFGGPVVQGGVSLAQSWVFANLGTASMGSTLSWWNTVRYLSGLLHIGGTAAFLWLAWATTRAEASSPSPAA